LVRAGERGARGSVAPINLPRGAADGLRHSAGNGVLILVALKTTNRAIVDPQIVVSYAKVGHSYIPPGRYTVQDRLIRALVCSSLRPRTSTETPPS
jgi:hypothetical protein